MKFPLRISSVNVIKSAVSCNNFLCSDISLVQKAQIITCNAKASRISYVNKRKRTLTEQSVISKYYFLQNYVVSLILRKVLHAFFVVILLILKKDHYIWFSCLDLIKEHADAQTCYKVFSMQNRKMVPRSLKILCITKFP